MNTAGELAGSGSVKNWPHKALNAERSQKWTFSLQAGKKD